MNDPLEETITNVKSINSEIETTNNNNSLEETENVKSVNSNRNVTYTPRTRPIDDSTE
ncbi:21659_t:CDS:2 [Entrophospora sp. SA101]|nr:21659_t:CDS:2 [Entrophospora sp. SA101]